MKNLEKIETESGVQIPKRLEMPIQTEDQLAAAKQLEMDFFQKKGVREEEDRIKSKKLLTEIQSMPLKIELDDRGGSLKKGGRAALLAAENEWRNEKPKPLMKPVARPIIPPPQPRGFFGRLFS